MKTKEKEKVGQLRLGGEKYIILSINVGAHQRNMVPLAFFPKKEEVVDLDKSIKELVSKQKPCFVNIPNTSPIDFIGALIEDYKLCDPHCKENGNGGLTVRVVLKPEHDEEAFDVKLTDEAINFLSCVCYLWGHDNRGTHSNNICLNFAGPRGGQPKISPVVEEGTLVLSK